MPFNFNVDKNVEVPTHSKYPFRTMNVGDSFFINADDQVQISRIQKNVLSAASIWTKRYNLNHKFKTKRYTSEEIGVRIWRIA